VRRLRSLDGWREATFSHCDQHRFHLGQRLTPANDRSLLVIGLNPSKATHLETDNTIRKLEKYARAWGFDRLDMTNLEPFRSTDPRGLLEADYTPVEQTNVHIIRWLASRAAMVLAAWGGPYSPKALQNLVEMRAEHIVSRLATDGVNLHCLDVTKDGHPRHPLYMPDATEPKPWKSPRAA
jgi:hypothetical protein